jgi:ornithine cyclodeaminase
MGDVAAGDLPKGIPSIGPRELAELVTMDEAIALVDKTMRILSSGGAVSPERWAMPVRDGARMGIMPGVSSQLGRFGIKVLSLFPPSQRSNLPSHQGVMLMFDLATGQPLCIIEGNALTSLRTAAASAVATRALSKPDASRLAILGCGEQARLHVEAIAKVRPIRSVNLWNRTRARAEELADRYVSQLGFDVRVVDSVRDAADGADIICTLTAAAEPVLRGQDLSPGQHLNIVGSSQNGPREVDDALVARARYVADCREHVLSQGAELISAVSNGLVGFDHVVGEIGDVLDGRVQGRLASDDITLYKSLGHIVQDLAVADHAHQSWQSSHLE